MVETKVLTDLAIALGGILVTVLAVYGAFIKFNYDGRQTLLQLLVGRDGEEGFIQEARDANQELASSQREIKRTLRAHGALLRELVYTLNDVAESLDEEDLEDVDTRRLKHLDERLREKDTAHYRPATYDDYPEDSESADD